MSKQKTVHSDNWVMGWIGYGALAFMSVWLLVEFPLVLIIGCFIILALGSFFS